MKLFAIYVGGEHPGANIEVHDMRFVVAASITDTHEALRQQWWGKPASLHIDCWSEVSQADGHEISLRPEKFEGVQKLYYVNLGGYDVAEFTEKHLNIFVVADTLAQAKSRALKQARGWHQPHRDDMYEAEQVFDLTPAVEGLQLHIHLTPNPDVGSPAFTCAYTPIRKRPGRIKPVPFP